MQHRPPDHHHHALLDQHRDRGGSTGSGGYAYFMNQVKMRLKREKSKTNYNEQTTSSSGRTFTQRRPYSCDVETLVRAEKYHHPDFYNHQATIARQTQRSRVASLGSKMLNSSQVHLAIVMDSEENVDESGLVKPPMATEEDFALESSISCSPDEKSPRFTNGHSSRNKDQSISGPIYQSICRVDDQSISRLADQSVSLRGDQSRSKAPQRLNDQSISGQNCHCASNDQSISNEISRSSDQPATRSNEFMPATSQSISGTCDQSILRSGDQHGPRSTDQSISRLADQSISRPADQSISRPADQSIPRPSDNSTSGPIDQSTYRSIDPLPCRPRDQLFSNQSISGAHDYYHSSRHVFSDHSPASFNSSRTPLMNARPFLSVPEEGPNRSCSAGMGVRRSEGAGISNEEAVIDRLQGRFNSTGTGKGVSVSAKQKYPPQPSSPLSIDQGKRQNLVVSVTSFDGSTAITTFPSPADRRQYQRSSTAKASPEAQVVGQARSPRGSLRRAKAVDLSTFENPQPAAAAFASSVSASGSPVKENQKSTASCAGRGPSKRHSILRKLIGGGGGSGSGSRNGSSEQETCVSPVTTCTSLMTTSTFTHSTMATGGRSVSSAGLTVSSVLPDSTSYSARSDFSSDSSDFKYEERVRRRIFVHYDCTSICADPRPLLNGTSRLKDSNLNTTTGASQASKPFLASVNTQDSDSAGVQSHDDGKNEQNLNIRRSGILVPCPYFLNEIGGEPIRYISLCRDTYGQTQERSGVVSCNCPACLYPYDQDGTTLTVPTCLGYQSRVIDENTQTWHQTATAAEASVLENLSNVYLGGRLCAKRQPQLVIEHVDQGAFYYRHCFTGRAHQNYFGIDENLGPVAISVVREKIEFFDPRRYPLTSPYIYRLIIRLSDLTTFRGAILEESLPSYLSAKEQQQASQQTHSSGQMTPGGSSIPMAITSAGGIAAGSIVSGSARGKIPVKELLELVIPELQPSCLRLAVPVPRTEELLLKLDEQAIYSRYKVGILYCRAEQSTEEQMYNNEAAGPAFDEFLDMLGQRVRLKGFDKYKGGLDCKGDTTGAYSLYTSYEQYEVMFHVSTMLPFTPQNKQQLARKRHIGNDIVTLVFQEPGALPFSPQTVRSHFQHVFIIIRVHNPNTDNVRYSVAVSRCKDVPRFGPPLPAGAIFPKSKEFRDFLLTKIINAENAVHRSEKFATMAARTRKEFMRDLAENHTTSHTLDGGASGKIASILLGGAAKRKDRPKPKLYLDACVRGTIVWDVQVLTQVEDFSLCRPVECCIGISADNVVLIEQTSKEVLFCTATHSIIGWSSHGNSLKLYYDHAEVIILRTLDDEDSCEMQEIIKRLHAVTKGCEAVEMILRRSASGHLDFNIQQEGIVTEVEMYGSAWQAGLRQGSRIVEICKVSVATLTYDRMVDLLQTSVNVRVLVVPPLEDGSPRRGCEDPYCPTVFSEEWPLRSSGSFSASRASFDSANAALGHQRLSLNLPQDRKQSVYSGIGYAPYKSIVRRPAPPFTLNQQQSLSKLQTGSAHAPSLGSDSGYYFPSKSLDDIQQRRDRRHSEDIRCSSADHSTLLGGGYRPNSYKLGIHNLDSRWYDDPGCLGPDGEIMPAQRTDTLSSSGSTASSEVSNDVTDPSLKRKPMRPSELKRRVDRANSDMLQRAAAVASILQGTGSIMSPPCAPPLPPRNSRNVKCHSVAYSSQLAPSSSGLGRASGRVSPLSLSSGHLSIPRSKQRLATGGTTVEQNLQRLIADLEASGEIEEAIIISSALQRLSEDAVRRQTLSASGQYHRHSSPTRRSPEKLRGVEWSSLVDAAARAIEGLSHRSASTSNGGSPEISGYRLRLQAALQRIKLLEEKVDRVQVELDAERESKRELEIEVLRLRDTNKRLDEECTHAKIELKKFTEWFFNAVENSTVGGALASSCIPPGMIPFADDGEGKG